MTTQTQNPLAVRLPYSTDLQANFNVDQCTWKVLVEAVWPEAQKVESVVMALAYCKARGLDPLKRVVHIVPVYNKTKKGYVDTVWPGIAEVRTTAARTNSYAGRDMTVFGPDKEGTWTDEESKKQVKVTFPEWAQVTVYRVVGGQRVAFAGPQVYWMETFASGKGGIPNSMWQKRPHGQLDKCAEAAALRTAFPEELGDESSEIEGPALYQNIESEPPAPTMQQPQRKSAALPEGQNGNGHAPANPPATTNPTPKPAGDKVLSEAEQRIELQRICVAIAEACMTVVTNEQFTDFDLAAVDQMMNPNDICVILSSYISTVNGKKVTGTTADKLAGKALAYALKNAKKVEPKIPTESQLVGAPAGDAADDMPPVE